MNLDVSYGITRRLEGLSMDRARSLVTEALQREGFGVLTEIDVAATLRAKLGVEREPYLILGACNPKLAREALEREPAIGLLLPCNVVLAKEGDDVLVSAASPVAMFAVVPDGARLAPIAAEAEGRLRSAIDRIERDAVPLPRA
jgi:uncharacterized protein (DUF302 family)